MKTKILSVLVIMVTGLTSVRATGPQQMNGKLKVTVLAVEDICYTGKPYNKEFGAYVFHARNYDPQINRGTTADPRGYPDGANNRLYSNDQPTSLFDPTGLDISGVPTNGTSGRLHITPTAPATMTDDDTGVQGLFFM